VRLSGRWLEAFGFKEGAKFTAIGVEDGLLVLAVYEPAVPFAPPRFGCERRGRWFGLAAQVLMTAVRTPFSARHRPMRAGHFHHRRPGHPRRFVLGFKCDFGAFFPWNIRAET
jgi:hypothetical protein